MGTASKETDQSASLKRMVRPFRAGDHVSHGPTGETWVLACDEERGEVMPCGWPMCIAKAADCSLVKPATDEERDDMLKTWSDKTDSESNRDWRTLTARRQWPNNTCVSDGPADGNDNKSSAEGPFAARNG